MRGESSAADFLRISRQVSHVFFAPFCYIRKKGGVLCEKYEIVPSAAVAEAAIPNCHIAFLEGAEMKTELSAFLGVLYGYKAQIVGGKLPDDAFYYAK